MYTLTVENPKGDTLMLSQSEANFQIIKIDGLNPPPATINSSTIAGMDGSRYNSSKLQERNIVITLKLNGDVEKNRLYLYRYFGTKQWCKLYYTNGTRNVHIEGYVETIECDLFSMSETMQISIICNNPYFKSMREMVDDISKIMDLFEFPFAIDPPGIEFSSVDYSRVATVLNEGENVTGLIVEIKINEAVTSPIIRNIDTGEFFGITGNFVQGDEIIIDTNQGSKSVKLIRNGITTNIFAKIMKNSSWLQLRIGENFFAYEADIGAEFMYIIFKHYYLYEGV